MKYIFSYCFTKLWYKNNMIHEQGERLVYHLSSRLRLPLFLCLCLCLCLCRCRCLGITRTFDTERRHQQKRNAYQSCRYDRTPHTTLGRCVCCKLALSFACLDPRGRRSGRCACGGERVSERSDSQTHTHRHTHTHTNTHTGHLPAAHNEVSTVGRGGHTQAHAHMAERTHYLRRARVVHTDMSVLACAVQ